MDEPLPYAGGGLDRAAGRRGDPDWTAALLASPAAVIVPLWRDRCLVGAAGGALGAGPVRLSGPAGAELLGGAAELLGGAAEAGFPRAGRCGRRVRG